MGEEAVTTRDLIQRQEWTLRSLEDLMWNITFGTTPDSALLRWAVEHAAEGDPLPAAWAASTDRKTMFNIVSLTVDLPLSDRGRLVCEPCVGRAVRRGRCRGCAARMRVVKPTLTLAEVIAWSRGQRL